VHKLIRHDKITVLDTKNKGKGKLWNYR